MEVFLVVVFWSLGLALAGTVSGHLAIKITEKEHDIVWKKHCERVNKNNAKTYSELLPIHQKEDSKTSRKTIILGFLIFSIFVSLFAFIHNKSANAIEEYETELIKSQEHKS